MSETEPKIDSVISELMSGSAENPEEVYEENDFINNDAPISPNTDKNVQSAISELMSTQPENEYQEPEEPSPKRLNLNKSSKSLGSNDVQSLSFDNYFVEDEDNFYYTRIVSGGVSYDSIPRSNFVKRNQVRDLVNNPNYITSYTGYKLKEGVHCLGYLISDYTWEHEVTELVDVPHYDDERHETVTEQTEVTRKVTENNPSWKRIEIFTTIGIMEFKIASESGIVYDVDLDKWLKDFVNKYPHSSGSYDAETGEVPIDSPYGYESGFKDFSDFKINHIGEIEIEDETVAIADDFINSISYSRILEVLRAMSDKKEPLLISNLIFKTVY